MFEQREHSDGLEWVLGSWMVSWMDIRLTVWNAECKQRINHSKMPMPLFSFHHQIANAPTVKETLKELHHHKVITPSRTGALWLEFTSPSAQGLWWSHGICTFMFTASSALFNKWQTYIPSPFFYIPHEQHWKTARQVLSWCITLQTSAVLCWFTFP